MSTALPQPPAYSPAGGQRVLRRLNELICPLQGGGCGAFFKLRPIDGGVCPEGRVPTGHLRTLPPGVNRGVRFDLMAPLPTLLASSSLAPCPRHFPSCPNSGGPSSSWLFTPHPQGFSLAAAHLPSPPSLVQKIRETHRHHLLHSSLRRTLGVRALYQLSLLPLTSPSGTRPHLRPGGEQLSEMPLIYLGCIQPP